MVTILQNNNPFGIFGWNNKLQITYEKDEMNSSALLVLRRTKGLFGSVNVSYTTLNANEVGLKERPAVANLDYTAASSSVVFTDGQTEAYAYIEVKHVSETLFTQIIFLQIFSFTGRKKIQKN